MLSIYQAFICLSNSFQPRSDFISSDLTPRPPSLRGQGERSETPLSVPGRGRGRGFLPNPPAPFPERAGGGLRDSPLRSGEGPGEGLRKLRCSIFALIKLEKQT